MNNANEVYKKILRKDLDEINKKIKKKQGHNKFGFKDIELEKLKIRSANLQEEIQEFEEREETNTLEERILNIVENRVDKKNDKTENVQQKIQELEELRSKIKSTRSKSRISRKIKHQQKILKRMKKGKNRLDSIQKTIMLPKYKANSIKKNILAKAEAKVNVTENKLQDIQEIKESLNPEASVRDDFKMILYDVKEAYYRSKLNRVNAVLEETRNKKSIITMRGANAIAISKNLANKFRNKLNSNELDIMTNNQPQISEQAARAR